MAKQLGEKNAFGYFGKKSTIKMGCANIKEEYSYQTGTNKNWRVGNQTMRIVYREEKGANMENLNKEVSEKVSEINISLKEINEVLIGSVKEPGGLLNSVEEIKNNSVTKVEFNQGIQDITTALQSLEKNISSSLDKLATKEQLTAYATTPVFQNAVESAVNNGRNKFFDQTWKIVVAYFGLIVASFGGTFTAINSVNSTNLSQLEKLNTKYNEVKTEVDILKHDKNKVATPQSSQPANQTPQVQPQQPTGVQKTTTP